MSRVLVQVSEKDPTSFELVHALGDSGQMRVTPMSGPEVRALWRSIVGSLRVSDYRQDAP